MEFPSKGMDREALLARLKGMQQGDVDWRGGRTFSLVYHPGDDVLEIQKAAATMYFSENALNPMAFPGLRQCETEVVRAALGMLHAPEGSAGALTTGGTESILMAVKAARSWARENRPKCQRPNMIVPLSVHPAFEKAAAYFDVRAVHAPLREDSTVDTDAVRALIDDDTILLVGSAPQYPTGTVDDIPTLAAIALEKGILCHVDACLGGFLLPWVEKLGYPVPPFDFRVEGVTSMSADVHKYGWSAKGASVVLYRERALRRHQFVAYADWPGGLYGSPSMTGTRAAGPIAGAWAVIHYLGEEGYLRLAQKTMTAARALIDGINAIPGLRVLGNPVASVFGFTADDIDTFALSDAMEMKGWKLDRLQYPPGLHAMISPSHGPLVGEILGDLRECTETIRREGTVAEGAAAMYGMLGVMEDRTAVNDFILNFLDGLDG
ncbi:MAG: aspartate aminotransferase family protein [Polyangiales bacterium]